MEFNPFDMFGGDTHLHPFPQSPRTQQNQRSFPPSCQTSPPMHENMSSWDNPFDMFGGDTHPFPSPFPQSRRTHENQRSFPPNMSSWGWPFEVRGHGSPNDPKPYANNRRDSTPPPASKPTTSRTNAHPAKKNNAEPTTNVHPAKKKNAEPTTNAHPAKKKNAEATTSRKQRVVSIPVYDAGTESPSVSTKAAKVAAPRMDQGVAAVKIQSTFRGFCVRNSKPLENLRIIGQVKSEADEMGRRLATQAQLIRGNEYECLKLDHQITSLLLRLDAIQGVKSFVRESMKAVYRLVFQLQETLDAIIATGKSMSVEGDERTPEMDSDSHSNRNSGTPELSETTQLQTEEVMKKAENCEKDTCELEFKGLDLSSSETVPVPVPPNEPVQHHIGGESIQCDAAACDDDGIGKGRPAVDKMENEAIQKVLEDLYRKVESNDKLIDDLSFRVAQLERQISEDELNDKDK